MARDGHGVLAVFVGLDGSRAIEARDLIQARGQLDRRLDRFVPGDHLARLGGHAPEDGGHHPVGTPLGFVVRLVLPDRVQQQLPLDDVGIRVGAAELPDEVLLDHLVALVNARLGVAQAGHDHGRAFRAVGVVGVGVPAVGHVAGEGE